MTIDIPAAQAICDAATPGPWSAEKPQCLHWGVWAESGEPDVLWEIPKTAADDRFVAYARTALPEALTELAQLRRERDEFEQLWKTEQGLRLEEQRENSDLADQINTARDNAFATERAMWRENARAQVERETVEAIAAWINDHHVGRDDDPHVIAGEIEADIRAGHWRKEQGK